MVFPRVGEDRDATQGRVTIREAAPRLGVKEDAVRKRIQRGVPATHARRRRPKTINGAYQMQGSSGPLQMHPASQLRLNGVLGSSLPPPAMHPSSSLPCLLQWWLCKGVGKDRARFGGIVFLPTRGHMPLHGTRNTGCSHSLLSASYTRN